MAKRKVRILHLMLIGVIPDRALDLGVDYSALEALIGRTFDSFARALDTIVEVARVAGLREEDPGEPYALHATYEMPDATVFQHLVIVRGTKEAFLPFRSDGRPNAILIWSP